MIASIQRKIENLERLRSEKDRIVLELIKAIEAWVLDLNTKQQLFDEGIDRKGFGLEPYKPFTIKIKQAKGQPTDRTTLRDTGAFHDAFFIEYLGDEFRLSSKDPKSVDLILKYGSEIFGLTDENLGFLKDRLKPEIFDRFRKEIFA